MYTLTSSFKVSWFVKVGNTVNDSCLFTFEWIDIYLVEEAPSSSWTVCSSLKATRFSVPDLDVDPPLRLDEEATMEAEGGGGIGACWSEDRGCFFDACEDEEELAGESPCKNHTRGLRYIILKIIHCEVGTMLKAYLCYIFSKTFIVQCTMLLFISLQYTKGHQTMSEIWMLKRSAFFQCTPQKRAQVAVKESQLPRLMGCRILAYSITDENV